MDDFFRANLRKLKGSDARLLLTLFALGDEKVSNAELMELSGVTDRQTFYAGLHRLRELGFMDRVGKTCLNGWKIQLDGWQTQPPQLANPTIVVGKADSPELEKPTTGRQSQPDQLEKPTSGGGESQLVSMDFEKALALADEMDADGDDRNPHSPFQARRKQQLILLEQAWADMFGEPLPPLTAKELLIAAKSQALDVYHAMQQAADYKAKYPRSYVRRTLENVAKKAPLPESDMKPVTEEMRQSWERNEALLKSSGWAWALED